MRDFFVRARVARLANKVCDEALGNKEQSSSRK